ncbi:MAG: hypothetical protein IKV61_00215 [Clostridia bacterium]|nr:hypothetical protein [Clostridia bacterium]
MNTLPIIVILFMLLKDKLNLSSLLNGIDIEGLAPIFELLNVDASILNSLNNDNFKQLLNGNLDFKTLLPIIMPIITSFSKNANKPFENSSYTPNYEDFSLIKDIAGQNVAQAFENYFD